MKYRPESLVGSQGVALVSLAFSRLGWAFRDSPILDYGLDAQVEVVTDGTATGRLLGLQIKAGPAFFSEPTNEGWIYRGHGERNLNFWLGHTLPVLIVLSDLDVELAYWQHITSDRIDYTSNGWKIVIPRSQTISPETIGRLTAIASAAGSREPLTRRPLTGPQDARAAIYQDGPAALLGARECGWLDAKSGVYRLDLPSGAEELAKDVAAFANTRTGGLLFVGFSTRKLHEEEILDAVKPVPRTLVDLDRHRKVIASRVMPSLRDVAVDWIDYGPATGVLIINIPEQPRSSQLFAVPAPTGTEQMNQYAVGVPVRQGDRTVWLPRHEIQRLVGLGWASSSDAMTSLATSGPVPALPLSDQIKHEVGGGMPEWRVLFQRAFRDLAERGLLLGEPVTEVYSVGPGVVQHFQTSTEVFGWVICSRSNRQPVAVTGDTWQALQDAGSGAPGGDALGALGFPVGDPASTRVVDQNSQVVELAGGRWGHGLLHRSEDERVWWWEPSPIPDTTVSAASRSWTGISPPPQLRVRVLATLPWADIEDLSIAADGIDAFVQSVPSTPFVEIMTAMSLRRGKELGADAWRPGPHQNSNKQLSYSSLMRSSEGLVAQSAEVMIALPHEATSSPVVTCAELRVENFATWAAASGPGGDDLPGVDLRWSISEIFDSFVAAWEIATEVLPSLVTRDPTRRRWNGVPRIELWIEAGQVDDGVRSLPLQDVVDLTALGDSDRLDQMTEMMIAVPAVPGLAAEVRRVVARKAIVEMAHRFGFMGAIESGF